MHEKTTVNGTFFCLILADGGQTCQKNMAQNHRHIYGSKRCSKKEYRKRFCLSNQDVFDASPSLPEVSREQWITVVCWYHSIVWNNLF